jgi:hypothetical protein
MYARNAMFPEDGDADATATYVSMYWEDGRLVGACIHVNFFKYLDMFVCFYVYIHQHFYFCNR